MKSLPVRLLLLSVVALGCACARRGGSDSPASSAAANPGLSALTFRSALLPTGSADVRAIVPGDFDGDADSDLFLVVFRGPNKLMLNDGRGGFRDGSAGLPASAHGSVHGAAGDFDGDGDLDLTVSRGDLAAGDLGLVLLRNDGRGTFSRDPNAFLAGTSLTARLLPFDADGDGDLDLLALRHGPGGIVPPEGLQTATELLRNNGSGGFTPDFDFGAGHSAALVVDVDADGALDVILAQAHANDHITPAEAVAYRIFLGDGRGGFTDAALSGLVAPAASGRTVELLAGDLDGDRLADLVAIELHATGPRLVRFLNRRNRFDRVTLPVSPPRALALGDFDADGDLDLFAAGIGLLPGDGRGTLQPASGSGLDSLTAGQAVAVADLNGDGHADAASAGIDGLFRILLAP